MLFRGIAWVSKSSDGTLFFMHIMCWCVFY